MEADLAVVRVTVCPKRVFDNGNIMSYDRVHWVDDFGMLGGAKFNRNCKRGKWGHSEEIDAAEFEHMWTAARTSATWPEQVKTANMEWMGAEPLFHKSSGWRPGRSRSN